MKSNHEWLEEILWAYAEAGYDVNGINADVAAETLAQLRLEEREEVRTSMRKRAQS